MNINNNDNNNSRPFLKWTREEFRQRDERIRKLMAMHKVLHPRDGIDRLYVSRKEEERGLANIEDSVDTSISRFEDYIKKKKERLITVIENNTNQQNNNNLKAKMGRKTTVWIFQAENKQNFTRENLDMAKKWKP